MKTLSAGKQTRMFENGSTIYVSKPNDNNSFPATVDDDFFDKLKQGSKFRGTGDIKFDMSWPGLACRTTENPVAVASAYKKIIDSTLSVLVGLK